MSGAAFFGIALVTGSKAVFTVAIFGHLLHLWFLGWVEGSVYFAFRLYQVH
jgi:phosphatidylethanolamine N-methyltransferase